MKSINLFRFLHYAQIGDVETMFYDKFKALCDAKGVSCNKAALEIGLSNATVPKWKKTGFTPKGDTLSKIAEYFGVTVDFLLGSEQEKTPTENGERKDILDEVDVAFYGDYKVLSEDEKATLRDMARIMRERREKKQEK